MDQLYSESVYLKILPTRIIIKKQPVAFLEVEKGDSFTLECQVSSHPAPSYQWFRDNTKLDMQTSNVLRVSRPPLFCIRNEACWEGQTLTIYGFLQVDKFSAKDEGKYYCYITNKVSEACTQRSNVIVSTYLRIERIISQKL